MTTLSLFKWRHCAPEVIGCGVRWSLRYALSYRDIAELLLGRGLHVDHTTVFRWGQCDAPELDKRCRPQLNTANDSYRVDETGITIKRRGYDLYRAVDSTGATLDFMRSSYPRGGRCPTVFPDGPGSTPYGYTTGHDGRSAPGISAGL